MKLNITKARVLTCIFSMMLGTAFSQSGIQWQRLFGGTSEEKTSRIIETPDSGYIAIGYTYSTDWDVTASHGNTDVWVVKISKYGALEWSKTYGGSNADMGTSICKTADGNYVFTAMSKSSDLDLTLNIGNEDFWIVKIDPTGNIIWQKTYGGTYADFPLGIIETSNHEIVVNGYTVSNDVDVTGNHGGADVWIIKLNASGNLIWQKTYGGNGTEIASQLIETSDLGYIFTSYTTSDTFDIAINHGGADIWNVKIDSGSVLQWEKTYGGTLDENAFAIKKTNDNNYVVAGWTASNDGDVTGNHGGLADQWIIKFDGTGTLLWQKCIGGANEDRAYDIIQKADNTFITAGYTNTFATHGNYDAWICKLTPSGDLVYRKNLGGSQIDVCNALVESYDHQYVLSAYTNSIDGDVSGGHGNYDFWIAKIAEPVRNVSGKIFADINANCLLDTSDLGIHNIILRDAISGSYCISEANGNYNFPLYNDTARLYMMNLDTIFSLSCLPSDTLVVITDTSTTGDLLNQDFPITSNSFCHDLNVNVTTGFFRTCRMANIYLNYENGGSIQADAAFIVLEIDTAIVDSIYSTVPYTQSGDTLIFNLGTVDAHEIGNIVFEGHAKCTAIGHSYNCVRAYIYPASNCITPNVAYDSSEVDVQTSCNGDTVKVEVKNRSSHNMNQKGSIRAYEDEIFQRIDSFIVLAGSTSSFEYLISENRTSTLIVNQNPHHPRNPEIIRFEDLCALVGPIVTHPVENDFSRYDDADDYEEYCAIIGNSWDPNIKSVSPQGFTDQHYTDSNQVLEYRIDFQNTGADTAFKVVIVDTLDENLDVATFQPLLASHVYTPVIEGNRTVKFVFDPIALADSGHSQEASHGFVTFKIKPIAHIARGTVINNLGDIYFDYNPPVRTNKVFNTIYDTLLINVGIQNMPEQLVPMLMLYPNPASTSFYFKTSAILHDAKLVMTDMSGKEVLNMQNLNGDLHQVMMPVVGSGLYLIHIYEKDALIGRGKIVVK